jgi:hypothetical protein
MRSKIRDGQKSGSGMDKNLVSVIFHTALHGYVVSSEQKIRNTNRKNRTARQNQKPKKQNSIMHYIFEISSIYRTVERVVPIPGYRNNRYK